MVPDSLVIKAAVNSLSKNFYENPLAIPALVHILQNAPDLELKQLAAVELRKLAISNWKHVALSLQPEIKASLLTLVFSLDAKLVRHSVARVVAAIAEVDLENNNWPELMPTLVAAVQDTNTQNREMAAYTLYALLETQSAALSSLISDFLALFTNLLDDQESLDIRVNAVLAMDVIGQFLEEGNCEGDALTSFKDSIPKMVQILKQTVAANDSDKIRDVFNVLNSLVYLDSRMVGDHLMGLIQIVAELSAETLLDEEYRCFGMQFLISCVSIRKLKVISFKLGPTLSLFATKIASEEIDVEQELSNENEENENEESSPANLGLRLLSTLASELAPSQVIAPLLEVVPSMMASSNQFERRAALLCVGVVSSGAPDYLSLHAEKIMSWIILGLQDPEIVVRLAALKSTAQLTGDIQDGVTDHHQELLPLIIALIDGATSAVVYKYACDALDGLIEFMDHGAMANYAEPLMNKLFAMLEQAHSSTLKTSIVSAIGLCAFASGKGFIPFFNTSIELLLPFVNDAANVEGLSAEDVELRAFTFENISTMARAVGSQVFSQYAKPLVEAAYSSVSSENSRIRESAFAFISNMAKVYGPEFAGFLNQIVPEILKCLQQEEFSFDGLEGAEAENASDNEEDEDDDGGFKVHTGITIEKEIAAVALSELALGTGKAFAEYVEPCVTVLHEQVENSYGMRETALSCLFKISKAMFVAAHGPDFKAPKGVPQQPYTDDSTLELIKRVRSISITLLAEEFETSMVSCILDSMADALLQFGAIAIMDSAADTSILEELCLQIQKLLEQKHSCQIDDEEGGDPRVEEEESSEAACMLYDSALEVLIALSIALGSDFVSLFPTFKNVVFANANSKDKNIRISSIGSLAEILNGIKSANPNADEFLKLFTEKLASDHLLEVKSNAAYGIGLLVEYSEADLSAAYPTILQLLFKLLSKTERHDNKLDDAESKAVVNRSYANACGCVARMALKNQQAVPLEHVVPSLLSHLPLETGLEENEPIFKLIILLYESESPYIVADTPRVVEIFAKVFVKELERIKLANESTLGREEHLDSAKQFSTPEIRDAVVRLLKHLEQKFAGEVTAHDILKEAIA